MFTNTKANANIFNNVDAYNQERVLVEAACLSTDTKPTDGIANGSIVIEMDTGKIFMFNESGSAWVELQ